MTERSLILEYIVRTSEISDEELYSLFCLVNGDFISRILKPNSLEALIEKNYITAAYRKIEETCMSPEEKSLAYSKIREATKERASN